MFKEEQYKKYMKIKNIIEHLAIILIPIGAISALIYAISDIRIIGLISASILIIGLILIAFILYFLIFYQNKLEKEIMKMIDTEALKILEEE